MKKKLTLAAIISLIAAMAVYTVSEGYTGIRFIQPSLGVFNTLTLVRYYDPDTNVYIYVTQNQMRIVEANKKTF